MNTKRVLMVAFHFPPFTGSSGVQRTLRFAQHLREFGWEPLVLTAEPRAYEKTSADLLNDVPHDVVVERAFALDAAKHFSIGGRYLEITARPDRWSSWKVFGVRDGMRLIRTHRPQVIWSTYPIATAHAIAGELQRRTKLPWIADFRDPMTNVDYPYDLKTWQRYRRIERRTITDARLSSFTTPGAERLYKERYPQAAKKIVLLENGYDEESFARLKRNAGSQRLVPGAVTLLHSGYVYPSERDPSCLFEALRVLADAGRVAPQTFRLRFRAPGRDGLLRSLAERHGVQAFCEFMSLVPYGEALQEMQEADGLLLLQAATFNAQIPAKLYEYLRTGRPILGLTDTLGNTAAILRAAGIDTIAQLDSVADIARVLESFVAAIIADRAPRPKEDYVARCSRRSRSEQLAQLLDTAAKIEGTES